MAIAAGVGFSCRPHFPFRSPFCRCIRKVRFGAVAAVIDDQDCSLKGYSSSSPEAVASSSGGFDDITKGHVWKKFTSKELGISNSLIPRPTRVVLNGLKRKGFQVYLVGGCVRDLILKQKPKDFDVLTSAELREVMRTFSQCQMVGRRFPICHVTVEGTIVEVSSFSTSVTRSGRDRKFDVEQPVGCDKEDYIRWRNCLERDFTINGLMLDPYAKIVYDYFGGVEDIRKAKVQTVKPSNISLREDSARILRGIRIASRLRFAFTRETARDVINLSFSLLCLDKGRLMMELNYMLAYGSAESSLRLLWRFGLLDILLPIQAAYFVRSGFRRRDKRSNMLLCLFSHLDKFLAPDMPCHSSLWVAILAFHKAMSDEPRDPIAVAAFSLALYNGGDMSEAVNIARTITRPHEVEFNELSEACNLDHEELKDEVMHLDAAVRRALSNMTDEYFVSQSMAGYPKAPKSDVVFISFQLYLRVCKIFECVREGKQKGVVAKGDSKIDNELLTLGSLQEVRHVFARVVFDTIYPVTSGQ